MQSIVGPVLVGTVQTALNALLGLEPNATREFTITATTGDIPAGTTYLLTDPNALLNVSGLESVIGAGVAGVASTTGGFILTLAAPITQGSSVTVDVYRALVNVGALSSFTLTQTVSDAVAGDNSATMSSLLAASVDLSSLGILGVSGSLTVQTCG
ncbi:hypothetical protein [Microbacterium sp.]|uniref:hypothetical protein n=1 Tax=Microbacterium sp. TaxID=51671 RepID=UPI0027367FAC|nr:hypothetical protein [Microbacterium sp.]MDP3949110.1 hypothetical protein [Microbacterium sp.]